MKVCLLNVELETNAGTERLVATHANALRKAKHEVDVACAYYKSNVFPEEFSKFKIIEYAKNVENLGLMHRTRISLSLLSKKIDFLKDYDAVIAYRPFTNVLAMKAKKKYNTKTLWYCSHPEKHLYPHYFKTLNKKNIVFRVTLLPGLKPDKESINYIDKTWVNSHHMWTKVNLIYNFNQHKVLYPPAGKLMSKSRKGDYLISVSRIEPEKNQLVLLKTLSLMKKPVKTVIIGRVSNQEYYQELKSFVKKHNLKVKFTGELSDKEIKKWYDKSFLNVYTPYDEDFGIVPLESISSGKPSITHVSNGVSEILPQRFIYSDVKELASKITNVKEGRIKGLTSTEKKLPIKVKKDHLTELLNELKQ